MKDTVVNILGVTYKIHFRNSVEDYELKLCDGYCDKTTKEIVVTLKEDTCNLGDFEEYQKKCVRHEIIHAFLFESGLGVNWEHKPMGHDETYVDWIAIQWHKIESVFKKLGV